MRNLDQNAPEPLRPVRHVRASEAVASAGAESSFCQVSTCEQLGDVSTCSGPVERAEWTSNGYQEHLAGPPVQRSTYFKMDIESHEVVKLARCAFAVKEYLIMAAESVTNDMRIYTWTWSRCSRKK